MMGKYLLVGLISLGFLPDLQAEVMKGVLSHGKEGYSLNGHKIDFIESHPVNGTRFNEKSRDFFVGKSVIANVVEDNGFKVTSMIDEAPLRIQASPFRSHLHKEFQQGFSFVKKGLFQNKNTRLKMPFQETLYQKEGYEPEKGDEALLISLSGRQGDDIGAAGGHFATGRASVAADERGLWLDGELFNIYVKNEKRIVPGVNSWADYFGDLTAGQSNYRPTWTLVVYGIQADRLRSLASLLENYYPLFQSGKMELTLDYNCTTISVQGLAQIAVYGVQRRYQNGSTDYPLLPEVPEVPADPIKTNEYFRFLMYSMGHKWSEFVPRNAWVSLLGNLLWLQKKEGINIDRIDLVYLPQTPSDRKQGGAPLNDFKDILNTLLSKKKSSKEIFRTLNKID